MVETALQKQEAKLKALNQKNKEQKKRIDQRLDKQIIQQANLDYAKLSHEEINQLAKKLAATLKPSDSQKF